MKRREFIVGTTAACLLSAVPFSGCSPFSTIAAEEESGKLRIKKSEFLEKKRVIIRSAKINGYLLVAPDGNNGYSAVSLICTHKQCELAPEKDLLACPCHGAEFSIDGKVLKGPAEKDLQKFKTTTDEKYIYIHLS